MSLGLLRRALSGWRRVIGIDDQRRLGGAVSLGLLGRRRLCGAVSLGLVTRASCGRHRVMRKRVLWAALCRWDWWGRRCVGGAVSLGLVGRAGRSWCGWRCVIGIAGQGIVWEALCH